jgi:putative addiction module killer protein
LQTLQRAIFYYIDRNGFSPAYDWLETLKDKTTRIIIKGRIRRVEEGNFGHTRNLGAGVIELKIDCGPGYRVYLGADADKLVIILVIGDKKSQSKDIKIAKMRWQDYLWRKSETKKN